MNSKKSLIIAAICIDNSPFARWAGSGNIESRRTGDLVISALFSAFGAFTKNEGLVLAAMNLMILLINAGIIRRKKNILRNRKFIQKSPRPAGVRIEVDQGRAKAGAYKFGE